MSGHEPTIVIVRRHASHEDDHHGGAWKIAFADFMTAMMAFFLVLWIVNSTNKETRTVIARYFNPIKLEDLARAKKGIGDDKKNETSGESPEAKGAVAPPAPPSSLTAAKVERKAEAPPASSPATARPSQTGAGEGEGEAALMADPAAALDAIAAKEAKRPPTPAEGFQDPFRPAPAARARPAEKQAAGGTPAEQEARRLGEEIAALARGAGDKGPGVRVQATDEGLLISLTDEAGYSMFAIGSARPEPRVVGLVAQIAEKLKTMPGALVLRGHTDARPFRSPHYDNWRLSSTRAQMAFYMLVRGGLDEARITRVEGYGPRKPLNSADPLAAENRRLEILLRRSEP
jgi:chemotaxis protein MotB